MEINLLEEIKDSGYHAYCVILTKEEMGFLKMMMIRHKMPSLESTLEGAINVGLGL